MHPPGLLVCEGSWSLLTRVVCLLVAQLGDLLGIMPDIATDDDDISRACALVKMLAPRAMVVITRGAQVRWVVYRRCAAV